MATKKEIDAITKMIDDCYNEETGEYSAKAENGTYLEGLVDALKVLNNEQPKNTSAAALGSIKSEKKAKASRENGSNWEKPHFKKCAHFEQIYPFELVNNEWRDKFVIGKTPTGRDATYNPDYFCPTTGYYIEVATSSPNISEQGWKWSIAIARGLKLKVYWWEGDEITARFISKLPTPEAK